MSVIISLFLSFFLSLYLRPIEPVRQCKQRSFWKWFPTSKVYIFVTLFPAEPVLGETRRLWLHRTGNTSASTIKVKLRFLYSRAEDKYVHHCCNCVFVVCIYVIWNLILRCSNTREFNDVYSYIYSYIYFWNIMLF